MEQAIRVMELEKPDRGIHLGDCAADAGILERQFPDVRIDCVLGNVDRMQAAPKFQTLQIEQTKVFLTHGHLFNVKYDRSLLELCAKATEYDANVVLFGHTHRALVDRRLCMDIMNPGTIGSGNRLSYGILTIDGKKVVCELRRL
jgi:hypothetical protein